MRIKNKNRTVVSQFKHIWATKTLRGVCITQENWHWRLITPKSLEHPIVHDSSNKLVLKPYSMVPGHTYCFEAKYSVQGVSNKKDYSRSDTDTACLTVKIRDLKPKIKGGNRGISIARTHILDATKTVDPDDWYYNGVPWSYSWTCEMKPSSSSSQPFGPCGLSNSIDLTNGKLHLLANTLQTRHRYRFGMTVMRGSRVSSTTSFIDTKDLTPLDVTTELVGNYLTQSSGNMKINALARVRLRSLVTPWRRRYRYEWTCNGLDLSSSSVISTKSNLLANLVLKPGALPQSTITTCSVKVTDPYSGSSGSSEIVLEPNNPPNTGTCFSNPDTGSALETDAFTFKCTGWRDDDMPLSYRFATLRQIKGIWHEDISFGSWSNSESLTIPLAPAGLSKDDYKVKIRAYVRDSASGIEAYTYNDFTITVYDSLNQGISLTKKEREFQLKTMSETVDTLAAENDLSQTSQYVGCVVKMLETSSTAATDKEEALTMKKQLMEASKLVMSSVDSSDSAKQSASILSSLGGKKDEIDEELGNALINQTSSLLESIEVNDLQLSEETATTLITTLTNAIDAMSTSGTSATASTSSNSGDSSESAESTGSKIFHTALMKATKSMMKSAVPGEDPVEIETETLKLTATRNYASALISNRSMFGNISDSDSTGGFSMDPLVFQSTGNETLDALFYEYSTNPYDYNTGGDVSSKIMSLSFSNENGTEFKVSHPNAEIKIFLPSTTNSTLTADDDLSCRFYDETNSTWSDEGCQLTQVKHNGIECTCSHLTTFAVILLNQGLTDSDSPSTSQGLRSRNTLTLVGVSVALSGVLLVVLTALLKHIFFKERKPVMLDSNGKFTSSTGKYKWNTVLKVPSLDQIYTEQPFDKKSNAKFGKLMKQGVTMQKEPTIPPEIYESTTEDTTRPILEILGLRREKDLGESESSESKMSSTSVIGIQSVLPLSNRDTKNDSVSTEKGFYRE